jgi:SAM-dependent methyltransferase
MIKHKSFWRRNQPMIQSDILMRKQLIPVLGGKNNIRGKRVLDAGCGNGYIARMFARAGAKVDAFDISSAIIRRAKESDCTGIGYRVGDVFQVADLYQNNKFDICLGCALICHFNEEELFSDLRLLSKALSVGAMMIVTTDHMEPYLKKASSRWVVFNSQPDASKPTQRADLTLRGFDGDDLFKVSCFLHSEQRIREAIESAGLKITDVIARLATEDDLKIYPDMWGDEKMIPYQLIITAHKSEN